MTTRWMHPRELENQRQRDRFDPVVEGHHYGLSRELSLAIWERVRADATDHEGRCDPQQAERRFHEFAARIAARGGRLQPDVGRLTRVGTEITGVPAGAWAADELAPRIPGRETLFAVEARRRGAQDQVSPVSQEADSAMGGSELPGASELVQAMDALQPSARPDPAMPLSLAGPLSAHPLDLRVWAPPRWPRCCLPPARGRPRCLTRRSPAAGADSPVRIWRRGLRRSAIANPATGSSPRRRASAWSKPTASGSTTSRSTSTVRRCRPGTRRSRADVTSTSSGVRSSPTASMAST